jgi:hypothetical protein
VKDTVNPFNRIRSLGYEHLIPITPAGCKLSERSSLYRRLTAKKPRDDRGKAPGIRNQYGEWFSLTGWSKPMEVQADEWHAMGAGVGMKLGPVLSDDKHLIALDADTYDVEHAKTVKAIIDKWLGEHVPIRIGQFPKALYLMRTDPGISTRPFAFGEVNENKQQPNRIEILAEGAQFVAHGIHPKTEKPYEWKRPLLPADELPYISADDLKAMLAEIMAALPNSKPLEEISAGDTSPVSPEHRQAPEHLVKAALEALPNTAEHFPSRKHYTDMMYYIRGAMPYDEHKAYEFFEDWALEYPDNTPDVVRDDWRRMKTEPRSGFPQILEVLRRVGKDTLARELAAAQHFDHVSAEEAKKNAPPEDEKLPKDFEQVQGSGDYFEMLSVADIMALPAPRYLIDRHLMQQSTCIVYGDPGAGKSFLTLDWALHLSSGAKDWHGDEIEPIEKPSVVYIAGEGVSGYQTRIKAWLARHPEADPTLPGFRLIHQTMNFTSQEMVVKLVKSIKHICGGATLIVVDTVAKSIAGAEENSTKEMGLFVAACVNISKYFDCAVIGVHHTNKAGGMRGSSAVPGGVDTIFKLERKKGSNTGYLMCEKQKDGPGEWTETFQLETVCVGVDAKGKPVSSLVVSKEAAEVREVSTQAAMLDALDEAWKAGAPWSDQMRAKERYAPRIMHLEFDVSAEHARQILSGWLAAGIVVVDTLSAKSKTKGLRRVVFEAEEEPSNPFE